MKTGENNDFEISKQALNLQIKYSEIFKIWVVNSKCRIFETLIFGL